MPLDADGSTFARLDAGGGPFNEPLVKIGRNSAAAHGVPESLPGFVRLPIIARC
jgi:hypothetical protein